MTFKVTADYASQNFEEVIQINPYFGKSLKGKLKGLIEKIGFYMKFMKRIKLS